MSLVCHPLKATTIALGLALVAASLVVVAQPAEAAVGTVVRGTGTQLQGMTLVTGRSGVPSQRRGTGSR